jgi:hypothetical protein
MPDRAQTTDLDLQARVADSSRQRAVHRATGDGAEKRADEAAVDQADGVVRRLVRLAPELHVPSPTETAVMEISPPMVAGGSDRR